MLTWCSRVVFVVVILAAAREAAAGEDCLPPGLQGRDAKLTLDLGVVGKALVACVLDDKGPAACWDVDLKAAALHARAAAPLPGHSFQTPVTAGCAAGFCGFSTAAPTNPDNPPSAVIAPSTTGERVAVALLHGAEGAASITIFDAKTRQRLRAFEPRISNGMVGVVYVGNQVFVLGADAGPFIGVWAHKDDGTKVRQIDSRDGLFNIFYGGIAVLDDHRVALSDASNQQMAIVTAMNLRRVISRFPIRIGGGGCKDEEFELFQGDESAVSAACARHLRRDVEPFLGAPLVALPGGSILAALRGAAVGDLAVLDGKTLREKRRVHLPVCARH